MYWSGLFSVGKWLICRGLSSTDSLLSYMLLNLGMRTYVVKCISASFNNVTLRSFCKMVLKGIYFWLQWAFVAVCGLSLAAADRGFLWWWLLWLQSTGSGARALQQLQHGGSVVVVCGLSCPSACGIFPDQGYNLCPLRWQVDSEPLDHQGSPV